MFPGLFCTTELQGGFSSDGMSPARVRSAYAEVYFEDENGPELSCRIRHGAANALT